jgi:hypothetical protein
MATEQQKYWLMFRIGAVEFLAHCTDGGDVLRALMFYCDDLGISRAYFSELQKAVMLDQSAVIIPISVAKGRAARFVSGCDCPMNDNFGG